jgi:hypothetical protein
VYDPSVLLISAYLYDHRILIASCNLCIIMEEALELRENAKWRQIIFEVSFD